MWYLQVKHRLASFSCLIVFTCLVLNASICVVDYIHRPMLGCSILLCTVDGLEVNTIFSEAWMQWCFIVGWNSPDSDFVKPILIKMCCAFLKIARFSTRKCKQTWLDVLLSQISPVFLCFGVLNMNYNSLLMLLKYMLAFVSCQVFYIDSVFWWFDIVIGGGAW